MYNLFLETRAAAQIREWCKNKEDYDVDGVLVAAYNNAVKDNMWDGEFDEMLVERSLNGESHLGMDVDAMFIWGDTPEGGDFWHVISDIRVPVPRVP